MLGIRAARAVLQYAFHPSEVFVPRITRKELKTDKFALEVGHTVTFFEDHQKELIRYALIVVAVVLMIIGFAAYQRNRHAEREAALAQAIKVQEAPVGLSASGGLSFPSEDAKSQAALKAFTDVQAKYPGSAEGEIAQYYLGSIKADQGKLAEAEKLFLDVSQKGDDKYASLAKLSLAQIYFADGRDTQGEKTLRDLIASPTIFVSKEQATMVLARYLMAKKPAEARKLLEPLRTAPGAVSMAAITLIGEMPPQ
jgi:predicted negative regulator of RcsB-dependent stress response